MADNQLRVSITADVSELGAGLDAATAQVVDSAEQMAAAQKAAAAATKNLAEAQAQLGASAAAGNAQAQAIIEGYAVASEEASAAVQSLTGSVEAATPALRAEAEAATGAAVATQYLGVSSRQAATAGIGILEGRMMSGNRAAGAFLSNVLGLGPALTAAFPVIGAVALGMVIVDITKGIVNFAEKAEDLARELNTDWLTGAIGQFDGLASAVKQADEEIDKMNRDLDETRLAGQRAAVEHIRLTQGAAAGYRAEAANDQQQEIKNEGQLVNLMREAAQLKKASIPETVSTGAGPFGGIATVQRAPTAENLKAAKELEAVNKQIADYQATDNNLLAEAANLELQAEQVKQKKVKTPRSEGFDEWMSSSKLAEEQGKEVTAAITEQWDRMEHANEEATKNAERADRDATEDWKKHHQEQIEMAKQAAEAEIKAAEDTFESAKREIALQEELGKISHRTATQMLLDAEALKAQKTQVALGKEQQLFNPAEGQRELQEFTQVENRMTAEARKAALQREQITAQETQKFIQQWRKVSNEFNSDFTQAFNAWATKSQTAGQAFGKMLGNIELQLVDFVAKWLLQKAEMWAMNEVLDVTGLGKQVAVQKTSQLAQVSSAAGIAFANTMAYYTAFDPPIAPAMAGAAAVETLSGGMTYDTGGMLPHMGFAFNKSGSVERVLSPSQTQNFESLVNNGGTRSATLNQTNHFGGGVTQEMLDAHTQKTMAQMRKIVRPEALQ